MWQIGDRVQLKEFPDKGVGEVDKIMFSYDVDKDLCLVKFPDGTKSKVYADELIPAVIKISITPEQYDEAVAKLDIIPERLNDPFIYEALYEIVPVVCAELKRLLFDRND